MRATEIIDEVVDSDLDFPITPNAKMGVISNILDNGTSIGKVKNIDIKMLPTNSTTFGFAGLINPETLGYLSILTLAPGLKNAVMQDMVYRNQKEESLKGIVVEMVFTVFLKKWDYFLSDGLHYKGGAAVWKNLRNYAVDNGYEIGVYNTSSKKIIPYDGTIDVEEWFSKYRFGQESPTETPNEEHKAYRFYIKRK